MTIQWFLIKQKSLYIFDLFLLQPWYSLDIALLIFYYYNFFPFVLLTCVFRRDAITKNMPHFSTILMLQFSWVGCLLVFTFSGHCQRVMVTRGENWSNNKEKAYEFLIIWRWYQIENENQLFFQVVGEQASLAWNSKTQIIVFVYFLVFLKEVNHITLCC